MSRLKAFIVEIHHRSIWQVLSIYLIGSWLAFEVIQGLTEGLDLPLWVPGVAFVLIIAGLPIVLASACVREEPLAPAPDSTLQRAEDPELEATAQPDQAPKGVPAGGLFSRRGPAVAILAVLSLWGLVAVSWVVLTILRPGNASVEPGEQTTLEAEGSEYLASVAVLPFENLGPEEDAFLGHGIAEDINSLLAQVSGLHVTSRTSVVALEGANLSLPQIADTLGVDHVMEGTIERVGGEFRVNAQLIEAHSDAHLWADTYTRNVEDLLDLREEIAREVMVQLVQRVPDLRSPGLRSQTKEPAAHEAYLRGKFSLHARTRENLLTAIGEFERALELDPTYAPAYAGLSAAFGLWVSYGYTGEMDAYQAASRSIAMADRAILLDINCAEAYSARGYVMTKAWAPVELVRPDFDRALELLPNAADVHGWQGHLLAREGNFELALAEAQRAIDLDPVAPGRRTGFALDALAAQEYGRAITEAERALTLEPSLLWPRQIAGTALLLSGRAQECVDSELVEPVPALRALCLYEIGRVEEAEGVIDSLTALVRSPRGLGPEVSLARMIQDLAGYFAWTGEISEATRWLEEAYEASPFGVDYRFLVSGLFDKAMGDPGFSSRLSQLREQAWSRVFRGSQVSN
ncbi:MAG: hypothetical protein ABIF09_08875 [Gemmatimonadota bacterium]